MNETEHVLQRVVALYLDVKGYLWTHVANERKTSARHGYRLKQAGVKSGVPDVLIFEPWEEITRDYKNEVVLIEQGPGVAIELKSSTGRVTKNQRRWLEHLRLRGWKTAVCRNLEEVMEICELIG